MLLQNALQFLVTSLLCMDLIRCSVPQVVFQMEMGRFLAISSCMILSNRSWSKLDEINELKAFRDQNEGVSC